MKGRCTVRAFDGHTQGRYRIRIRNINISFTLPYKKIKYRTCTCTGSGIHASACQRAPTLWYIGAWLLLTGVSCVQFDDTRIVSGSYDKTIKVRHSMCLYMCRMYFFHQSKLALVCCSLIKLSCCNVIGLEHPHQQPIVCTNAGGSFQYGSLPASRRQSSGQRLS